MQKVTITIEGETMTGKSIIAAEIERALEKTFKNIKREDPDPLPRTEEIYQSCLNICAGMDLELTIKTKQRRRYSCTDGDGCNFCAETQEG